MTAVSAYRDDATLVQACLDKNEQAWNALVDRYGSLVYSISLHYGLTAGEADDVFQNVFITAYRRLSTLKSEKSLTAWLATITRREALHVAQAQTPHDDLHEGMEDDSSRLTETIHQWERRQLIQQGLNQLEARCRELLTLLFFETAPLRYEQIARRLGIPVGSIGPYRARCFSKLEKILISLGIDSII